MKIYRLVFSPIEVNTYILADESGSCIVIDCGCFSAGEFQTLVSFLEKNKLKPEMLLNTHCHLDHIFGNRRFLEKYGIGAVCHSLEKENRDDAVSHAMLWGLKMDPPPEPQGLIIGGDIIKMGKIELTALFVPGHTAGSLAFYSGEEGVVFTGDALFSGSIGRTDLQGGDFETLIHSIKTRLFTLPPATIVYPGHGESTTIERELKTNPYFSNSNG
jgi:hydroxyacylglutathione hydrolase